SATAKPVEAAPVAPKPAPLPNARELVSIRLEREVLEHFQADGAGWQDRINAVLRKAMETK
ncbi:MAG TPA: BrnA antitoxin family protein, partial [Ancylobacter sp.]